MDEALRHEPPVDFTWRIAARDLDQGGLHLRDGVQRAADERARAARANQGPTAPRGSMTWWYEYANDYSHGYLTRATGYVDPRYGPMGSRGPSILDGPRGGYRSGFGAGAGPGTGATGAR
jgi:hypothetical protein